MQNYYEMLGISDFTSDLAVIGFAYSQVSQSITATHQGHPYNPQHDPQQRNLLAALQCLMSQQTKTGYDQNLLQNISIWQTAPEKQQPWQLQKRMEQQQQQLPNQQHWQQQQQLPHYAATQPQQSYQQIGQVLGGLQQTRSNMIASVLSQVQATTGPQPAARYQTQPQQFLVATRPAPQTTLDTVVNVLYSKLTGKNPSAIQLNRSYLMNQVLSLFHNPGDEGIKNALLTAARQCPNQNDIPDIKFFAEIYAAILTKTKPIENLNEGHTKAYYHIQLQIDRLNPKDARDNDKIDILKSLQATISTNPGKTLAKIISDLSIEQKKILDKNGIPFADSDETKLIKRLEKSDYSNTHVPENLRDDQFNKMHAQFNSANPVPGK